MACSTECVIAQISDSHLFANEGGRHFNQPVFDNLLRVFSQLIKHRPDVIIFTGDMTQDHTEASYTMFQNAYIASELAIPVYILFGNHDDPEQIKTTLDHPSFSFAQQIEFERWQCLLVNSKSDTPAGIVSEGSQVSLMVQVSANKSQLVFMHHHPSDIGFFIDRHGLLNQDEFWQCINDIPTIKGIACGHVHSEKQWIPHQSKNKIPLYACPATSIQFDPTKDTASALPLGPGYRLFTLSNTMEISTEVYYLDNEC